MPKVLSVPTIGNRRILKNTVNNEATAKFCATLVRFKYLGKIFSSGEHLSYQGKFHGIQDVSNLNPQQFYSDTPQKKLHLMMLERKDQSPAPMLHVQSVFPSFSDSL